VTTLIRNIVIEDMPIVVDLDDEAFSPYGTAVGIEVFRARLQSFLAGFIVL
jgi:hypothetical protein